MRAAYDAVAADYAEAFADDLVGLPVDRAVLDDVLARTTAGPEPLVLDLGCGPGQVGDYLSQRGARVVGADLSPNMLAVARRRTGRASFAGADMRALPFPPATFAAVVAYYSVQHVPRSDLGAVLDEVGRVLIGGGLFALATHLGQGDVVTTDFLGHQVEPVAGALYQREELETALADHQFTTEVARERGPQPNEHQSQRIYLIARRR